MACNRRHRGRCESTPVPEASEGVFRGDCHVLRAAQFGRCCRSCIGLWGPRIQKAFAEMGVMDYARIDVTQQLANDGKVAEDFDRKMFVEKSIAAE